MTYEQIDRLLEPWLKARNLHMFTEYKGEPVRSIELVSRTGDKVQIWIDPPSDEGTVRVHVWDYGRRREDRVGKVGDVSHVLEAVYETANRWLEGE